MSHAVPPGLSAAIDTGRAELVYAGDAAPGAKRSIGA
jgi:hypothetical protein